MRPKAIRKSDIKSVVGMRYKDYEVDQCVPSRYKPYEVVAKLIRKDKFPNFEDLLSEISLILPLEGNEKLLEGNEWVKMSLILKV